MTDPHLQRKYKLQAKERITSCCHEVRTLFGVNCCETFMHMGTCLSVFAMWTLLLSSGIQVLHWSGLAHLLQIGVGSVHVK